MVGSIERIDRTNDTGEINRIRQMGVVQLSKAMGEKVINSPQELLTLSKSTAGKEDDIVAGIIAQNFQVFAKLDGKSGLSQQDLFKMMASTDVAKGMGNEVSNASNIIHEGIIVNVIKADEIKELECNWKTRGTSIAILRDEEGALLRFYARATNEIPPEERARLASTLQDPAALHKNGILVFIECQVKGDDGKLQGATKDIFLPIPPNDGITNKIRSFAVHKEDGCYKVDIYLDAVNNAELNGAKVSYTIKPSAKAAFLIPNAQGKTYTVCKVSPNDVGGANIDGLVALGGEKYVGVQNTMSGLYFINFVEEAKDGATKMLLKSGSLQTSSKYIKQGRTRDFFGSDSLINYEVKAAQSTEGKGGKIYVLLVSQKNKNQHILLTVDKDKITNTKLEQSIESGYEFRIIPSDVLKFSNISNMAVLEERAYFFCQNAEIMPENFKGSVFSLLPSKLPSVPQINKE